MAESDDDIVQQSRPISSDDLNRTSRMVRNQLTVIRARAQLARRRMNRGELDLIGLDRSLDQIDLAVTRIEAALRRLEECD